MGTGTVVFRFFPLGNGAVKEQILVLPQLVGALHLIADGTALGTLGIHGAPHHEKRNGGNGGTRQQGDRKAEAAGAVAVGQMIRQNIQEPAETVIKPVLGKMGDHPRDV